jgi:hypothetical protein
MTVFDLAVLARRKPRCRHGNVVCSMCSTVSDEAKRAYDIVNSYAHFVDYDTRIGSWVAVRLADGGSDGTLYASKRDAVRHQADEFLAAYFSYRNAPSGFASPLDAELWLRYHRAIYDQGFRLPDPDARDGGKDVIAPLTGEQFINQLRRLSDPRVRN